MEDGVVPFWIKSLAPLSLFFLQPSLGMEEGSESRGREKDRKRRRRRRGPSESFTDDQGIHRGRERSDRHKRDVVKMPKSRVGSASGAWGKPAAPPAAPAENSKGVVEAKGYLGRTSGFLQQEHGQPGWR